MSARGFTLVEVLVALVVFALVAAVSWGALAPAGEGFRQLKEVRDAGEHAAWVGRSLRSDVAGLSVSAWRSDGRAEAPIRIVNDNRGEAEFDECWLLVRMPGRAGIWQVHYFIDEGASRLRREMRLLWSRDVVQADNWDMGEAVSFAVEAMDANGRWRQEWTALDDAGRVHWPRALRFRIGTGDARREWVVPVLM
ncbi:MAG: prepilin-type N-terminal cleavage/methylation domain-containing protein, partial [Mariprofundaceae bacterium]